VNESYNINSILSAIEDLNKTTKNSNKTEVLKRNDVPPQVDKIIREAEEYKKGKLSKLDIKNLSLDQGVSNDRLFSNVEQDKTILLNKEITELKTKLEYQTIIYRENYEKIIIENNDIKQRLDNAKQQINSFKESKSELQAALLNLNNVLSKSSIIGNIAPMDFSSKNNIEVLDLEKNKEIKD
jgi:hypothetical protein